MIDVIVIGSGIIGASIARELSRYNLQVLVLEKNNDVSNETTMANSAIVHSGYDPEPGTNKAKYNAAGNAMYESLCKELMCDYRKIGSLTVAIDEEQFNTLKELKKRAEINGVPVHLLSRDEALEIEPNLSDEIVGALYAPSAAIIYPWEVAIALLENAMDNGVELYLNHEVKDINRIEGGYRITATTIYGEKQFESKCVINSSGIFADTIHNMVGKQTFIIKPRRGQYYVLDKSVGEHVRHVIFPCPSEKGKGVLITPTTHGNILVGPTSEIIDDVFGTQTTYEGLDYIKEQASKIVKDIPYHKVIRSFAGVRPSSDRHDFIIEEVKENPGFIDVGGIESPGLASAPAIALEAVRLIGLRLDLNPNIQFDPYRKGYIIFDRLSLEEKQQLIKTDSRYGKIVCRCERVTEGEIVDCIKRNAGARSIKGVKKRVRPGMGRCQGGFCEPLVLEILARELNISPLQVEYDSIGSNILVEETKQGGTTDEV